MKRTVMFSMAALIGLAGWTAVSLPSLAQSQSAPPAQNSGEQNHPIRGSQRPTPEQNAAIENALKPGNDLYDQAKTEFQAGDYVKAEQDCQQSIAIFRKAGWRDNGLARALIGDIYLAKGQYQNALDSYAQARKQTNSIHMRLNTALCYAEMGNQQMALQFYSDEKDMMKYDNKLIESDLPGTGDQKSLMASILMARGQNSFLSAMPSQALEDYSAALKLKPKNGLIAYYVGRCLLQLNRSKEAVPYFQIAAKYGRGELAHEAQGRAGSIIEFEKNAAAKKQTNGHRAHYWRVLMARRSDHAPVVCTQSSMKQQTADPPEFISGGPACRRCKGEPTKSQYACPRQSF